MKIIFFYVWALCLLMMLSFQSCVSKSIPATSVQKGTTTGCIFSNNYYVDNAHNNVSRMHLLLQGLFSAHSENIKTNVSGPWLVNGDKDSILVYNISVGEVAKDGYWIYMHQFMSNMPDAPVYTAFQHLRQVSRDTISSVLYEVPIAVTFEDLQTKGAKLFEEVDFKTLKPMEEAIVYIKSNEASFSGESCVYENPRADRADFRKDIYQVCPKMMTYRALYFKDKAGTEEMTSNIKMKLIRIKAEESPLFNMKLN